MSHYTVIPNAYRFARINDDQVGKYMPSDLAPLANFLIESCGMQLDGIYLENYKGPDTVVVMRGKLPIDALKGRFDTVEGLRFGVDCVVSDMSFSSLRGDC